MNLAIALLLAAALVPLLGRRSIRAATWLAGLTVLAGVVLDAANVRVAADLAAVAGQLQVLSPAGPQPVDRLLLLAALVWSGPAADVVVRGVLVATGVRVPPPGAGPGDGRGAGRWIGRLERWLLVLAIAAGQAALAVIAVGGKALFRYAEVVADARATQPRLERPDATTTPPRDTLVDYVIVGSLASWTQAIALGLLIAA